MNYRHRRAASGRGRALPDAHGERGGKCGWQDVCDFAGEAIGVVSRGKERIRCTSFVGGKRVAIRCRFCVVDVANVVQIFISRVRIEHWVSCVQLSAVWIV